MTPAGIRFAGCTSRILSRLQPVDTVNSSAAGRATARRNKRLVLVMAQNPRFRVIIHERNCGSVVCSHAVLPPREPPRNIASGSKPWYRVHVYRLRPDNDTVARENRAIRAYLSGTSYESVNSRHLAKFDSVTRKSTRLLLDAASATRIESTSAANAGEKFAGVGAACWIAKFSLQRPKM